MPWRTRSAADHCKARPACRQKAKGDEAKNQRAATVVIVVILLLLVVEEHVLRLLAHHREHLGRVCGMYLVRDLWQGPFRGLACGAASPAW